MPVEGAAMDWYDRVREKESEGKETTKYFQKLALDALDPVAVPARN